MFPHGFDPDEGMPQDMQQMEQMLEGMMRGMLGDATFERIQSETQFAAERYRKMQAMTLASDVLDARQRLANGAREGHLLSQRMLDIADKLASITTLEPFATPYDEKTYKPKRFVLGWHGRGRKGDAHDVWFHETFDTLEDVIAEIESVSLTDEHIPGYVVDLETAMVLGDGFSGKFWPDEKPVSDFQD